MINFEWDSHKAETNFKKHGILFEEAKTVFDDPFYLDFYDPDHSDEEHRYIILGDHQPIRYYSFPILNAVKRFA